MKEVIETAIATIWRFFVATLDWRTHLRFMARKPIVDAVFITNMRDETDRKRYLGLWRPRSGHFNGPRYHICGVIGRTRAIDSITGDLLTVRGRKKAQEQFVLAVKWAEKRGAKVILLAASTKRLFGESDKRLKELFPNILFTIGDNGTSLLLLNEVLRAFREANLKSNKSRIGVLGPYGFLGEPVTEALKKEGYDIIGAGANVAGLDNIAKKYGIEICQYFDQMGKVDAIVACTHSDKIRLTADNDDFIRKAGKRLLVIDVAEPPNLTKDEYDRCKEVITRQDAGNAYSPNLSYVLGAISYRMFRLSKGVTFGCFAEALSLAAAIKRGEKVEEHNWFEVNNKNKEEVAKFFQKIGFAIPSPRCFGEPVKSFDLTIGD